jgi:hypothetical protein
MRSTTKVLWVWVSLSLLLPMETHADMIVGWGLDNAGQVSAIPAGSNFTAIAPGAYNGLGLTSDGSIRAWGFDYCDPCEGAWRRI